MNKDQFIDQVQYLLQLMEQCDDTNWMFSDKDYSLIRKDLWINEIQAICKVEVIYSETHQSPVLILHVKSLNGIPISIQVLQNYTRTTRAFTCEPHPISAKPVFIIHPCHTRDLMGIMHANGKSQLFVWLNSILSSLRINAFTICYYTNIKDEP
ncbi:hypothetical protein GJ496_011961 [Pomphorhynchus laevis]|nr:hypothetical protein GJ496_011961 [Pomphorhynchus laevis]